MAIGCGQGELAVMGGELRISAAARCALLLAVLLPPATAGEQLRDIAERAGLKIIHEGTTSRELSTAALKKIPWERMSEKARRKGKQVTDDLSQFRRMPVLEYEADPTLYRYLIVQPDVAVSTWRAMGISQLEIKQATPFSYTANAIDGSHGTAHVLWRDPNQCLFVVEGSYTSPFLPTSIQASALVWVRYRFTEIETGHRVHQEIEAFLHFPSATIETLAKLASRVTNVIMDRNVFEVSLYARMMSQAAQRDSDWIENLVHQMEGVPPEKCRDLLLVSRNVGGTPLPPALTAETAVRAEPLIAGSESAQSDPVPVLPPTEVERSKEGQLALPLSWVTSSSAGPPQPEKSRTAMVSLTDWKTTTAAQQAVGFGKPQISADFAARPDGELPHFEVPQLRTGRAQSAASRNVKPTQHESWAPPR